MRNLTLGHYLFGVVSISLPFSIMPSLPVASMFECLLIYSMFWVGMKLYIRESASTVESRRTADFRVFRGTRNIKYKEHHHGK
jgi:hypothetical protein